MSQRERIKFSTIRYLDAEFTAEHLKNPKGRKKE